MSFRLHHDYMKILIDKFGCSKAQPILSIKYDNVSKFKNIGIKILWHRFG